jgi:molybdopterin-guanine dinucleotide biosynthesis protein A
MSDKISAIILAGGRSTRMGRDKARLKLDGKLTLLRSTADKLRAISEQIIISTDGRRYEGLGEGITWADDAYPGGGSLVGLYSALKLAVNDYSLAVACDMPFLNIELLRYMLAQPRDYDILTIRVGRKIEPLHAIYAKSCLPIMAEMLATEQKKIHKLYDKVKVRYITEDDIDRYDPEHLSFYNINTPEELAEVNRIIEGRE